MESIFFVCSVAGGSLLVLQFLFSLIGGNTDVDVDADLDLDVEFEADSGDAFVKLLSIKTIVGGITFFGLTGLAAGEFGLSANVSLILAVVAGLTAVYVMAHLMRALHGLQSRGNVDLSNAQGAQGRCYLRIPERGKGTGKITLTVQGRKVECDAVTEGPEIPTGATVQVIGLRSESTLEVASLSN